MSFPVPFDEPFRQQVLDELGLVETDAELEFDRITKLATELFSTEIALVSLLDHDRQWFKSRCGLDAGETHRNHAFCAHAVAARSSLVVLNARKDARFRDNPLVTGAPFIRFYAGVPIVVDGAAIGTLCVIDSSPRTAFETAEVHQLSLLAGMVEDAIELRRMKAAKSKQKAKSENGRKLAQASVVKQQFLSLISHELRTPLNAIIGFAECITEELHGPLEPSVYHEYAKEILKGGTRQLQLVERVLKLTDQGYVDMRESHVDVADVLLRCVQYLQGEAQRSEVSLELGECDDLSTVLLLGDSGHIELIIRELISNAVKFTPADGRAEASAFLDESGNLVIRVIDTGVGIDENFLEQVDEIFTQESNGATRKFEGAGLGLAIVRKLAEMHQAHISLTPQETGGTSACVIFPKSRLVRG